MNTRKRMFSVVLALALMAGLLTPWTQEKVLAADQSFTIDDETSYQELKKALSGTGNNVAGVDAASFDDATKMITIDFDRVRVFKKTSYEVLSEQAQEFVNELFSRSTKLQTVELNNTDLGKIDFSNLDGKPLDKFSVVRCGLTSIPNIKLPELTKLDVSRNDFSAAGACAGLTNTNFPKLTDLTMYDCNLKSFPDSYLPTLKMIVASGNDFSDRFACNTINRINVPFLERLYLDSCQISSLGWLSDVSSTLTLLSLGTNKLTNDSLVALIANKGKLPNLESLSVGCKVFTGSATSISSGINFNNISDTAGLASLLTAFPNLKSMDLSGLGITSLHDFVDVGDDVTLFLEYNKITDFSGLDGKAHIYLSNQVVTVPGKFVPGEECELPELLKRVLDPTDNLYGSVSCKNCKVSDDKTKLIINADVERAEVKVSGGKIDESTFIIMMKKKPTYTIPQGLTADVGDTLAKVALPAGFTWKNAAQDVGAEGTNTFEAVYTPEDTNEYLTVNVKISVKVTNPVKPTEPTKPTEPETEPTSPTEPETEPTSPVEPTKPVDPTEPVTDPTSPVDPTKPDVDPTESQPTNPVEPTKPVDPTEPVVVEPTAAPSDEYDEDEDEEETAAAAAAVSPRTSDTSPVVPVTVVLLVSGMVLCFVISDKNKKLHLKK